MKIGRENIGVENFEEEVPPPKRARTFDSDKVSAEEVPNNLLHPDIIKGSTDPLDVLIGEEESGTRTAKAGLGPKDEEVLPDDRKYPPVSINGKPINDEISFPDNFVSDDDLSPKSKGVAKPAYYPSPKPKPENPWYESGERSHGRRGRKPIKPKGAKTMRGDPELN